MRARNRSRSSNIFVEPDWDAAISRIWEIADDKSIAPGVRIEALSLLKDIYEDRGTEAILAPKYFEKAKDEEKYGR